MATFKIYGRPGRVLLRPPFVPPETPTEFVDVTFQGMVVTFQGQICSWQGQPPST